MADWRIGQGNLGDLANVGAGDTVTLEGHITGLPYRVTQPGITFRGEGAVLHGDGAAHAFYYGGGDALTLSGLEIEGYSPGQQRGAIHGADSAGWTIDHCNIHHNGKGGHGYGLRLGHQMAVTKSRFNDNGSLGIGGVGDDIIVEDVEIARNNWRDDWTDAQIEAWLLDSAQADPRLPGTYDGSHGPSSAYAVDHFWEGGGAKLVHTNRLRANRIHVHHNGGRGWWPDISNVDGETLNLTCEWNAGEGFCSEIGGSHFIRHVTLRYNGMGDRRGWLWGAQGLFQNCTDNVMERALIVCHARGINGFAQINQGRTPRAARNVLRDSVIVYESDKGRHGWVSDSDGGEPLTWDRVRVIASDGGTHVHSHGALLPGGDGPLREDVGALLLPVFTEEPPPSGGGLEDRVAQADDLLAQGSAALDVAGAAIEDARAALNALHTLAITPVEVLGGIDVATATDEELVAESDRIKDEMDRRLIEQS